MRWVSALRDLGLRHPGGGAPRRTPERGRRIAPILGVLWTTVAFGLPAGDAHALESAWAETDQTAVRLIAARTGLDDRSETRIGLQFRLKPDWKVYWRSPGDAGLPPKIDWTSSSNLDRATLSWPTPERFEAFGLETYGYTDEVILPIRVVAQNPRAPLGLRARVEYLACHDICIPYEATLALTLVPGPGEATAHAHAINRFQARVPQDAALLGLAVERASLVPRGRPPALELSVRAEPPLHDPDIIVEGPAGTFFGHPSISLGDGGTRLRAVLPAGGLDGLAAPLSGQRITVTLIDGARVAEQSMIVSATAVNTDAGFAFMLAVALLGGLILNVMPCVLPVLALKLMSAIGHGGGSSLRVRLHFVASAAGILVSFAALAGALIALKQAGVTIGWGIQFQQPLFLSAMVVVVALFAANLWDAFHIPLPAMLTRGTTAFAGDGLGGSFAAGAFAAVLATPCSAPFVGTSAGFALARGPGEIVAIFLALGLGLALPYLMVAAFPALATALPRPGRWMVVARRILGVALTATAVWLLGVLSAQTGPGAAGAVAGLVLAAWLGLAALRQAQLRPARRIAGAFVAAACAGALIAPIAFGATPPAMSPAPLDSEAHWVAFDEAAIAGLVADGKVVFVDVRADWCITCQVNKAAVLSRAPIRNLLSGPGVVAMRADWTRPDDLISRYLGTFGRYGIPFNAVYGPRLPRGQALPELLTTSAVEERLISAGGATGQANQETAATAATSRP